MNADDLFPVTRTDMVMEVERELALRRRVYPRLIATGRMKLQQAERQITVMEAVLEELRINNEGGTQP
jgi:hypothetical protein